LVFSKLAECSFLWNILQYANLACIFDFNFLVSYIVIWSRVAVFKREKKLSKENEELNGRGKLRIAIISTARKLLVIDR
jgi:hypothetical protein